MEVIDGRILMHRIERFNIGSIHESNFSGKYKIIDISNKIATVKFIDTGYIKKTGLSHLRKGTVKDLMRPRVTGVGYLGSEYDNIIKSNDKKFVRKLYSRWRNMLKRCYSSDHKNFNIYGGAGVSVDKKWHNFSKFFYDVQKIDGWNIDKFMDNKIQLDKDKFQQNVPINKKIYSKKTCCWLSAKEQNELIDFSKAHEFEMINFVVIFPDGHIETHKGIGRFANKYNLCKEAISQCILGKQQSHAGYKFEKI